MSGAPEAGEFAARPASWQVVCASAELRGRPVSRDLFGRRVVAFRSGDKVAVMDGRCWHLGADLGGGAVVDGCVACPFHGWRFDAAGRCVSIPAQREIPPDARQVTFAAAERDGVVWAFPAARPLFELPWFEGVPAGELTLAPPFVFELDCPWWMVGTNGFDAQHFAGTHDRRLAGPLVVTTPHPFARRVEATFEVVGDSWRDRLTRLGAGRTVNMIATVWGGTVALVEARFGRGRRATYGVTTISPVDSPGGSAGTRVEVRVGVRRGPTLVSALEARVRSNFVRAFLRPDSELLNGARYDPSRLVDADREMIGYLRWLAPVSHGFQQREDGSCSDFQCSS